MTGDASSEMKAHQYRWAMADRRASRAVAKQNAGTAKARTTNITLAIRKATQVSGGVRLLSP
jgi:hypothetical protein